MCHGVMKAIGDLKVGVVPVQTRSARALYVQSAPQEPLAPVLVHINMTRL